MSILFSLKFETPQPGGPYPRIYIPQKHGGSVMPLDNGLFWRLVIVHLVGKNLREKHAEDLDIGGKTVL
jgi:hypothetical protein